MKRIIGITSAKGVGKTNAASYFAPPSKIHQVLYFDTEDSTSSVVEELKENERSFGALVRMYERLNMKADEMGDVLDRLDKGEAAWVNPRQMKGLVEYYDYFVNVLNEKTKEKDDDGQPKYRFLCIDTMGPILAAMTAAVEDNPKKFGWSSQRAYGKLEVEGVRPLWENMFEAAGSRGIEWIILTSHIKPVWHDNKPILNKVKAGGRTALLARLTSLWFWLVKDSSNADGAPAAIKLKGRLGKLEIDEKNDLWIQRTVLPERIPHFTWNDVWAYKENPANLINPAPGETMSFDERDMISELINDLQMKLMLLSTEADASKAKVEELNIMGGSVTLEIPIVQKLPVDTIVEAMRDGILTLGPAEWSQSLNIPFPVAVAAIEEAKAIINKE